MLAGSESTCTEGIAMKVWKRLRQIAAAALMLLAMSACAVAPGPYYRAGENLPPPESTSALRVGINDRNYVMQIFDRTPFGFRRLPQTENFLYDRGYDRVRRERDADFSIDVTLTGGLRDNPDVRAGNTLGGALAGAAAGAIIGGALGDPGPGAAIGAASGGLLGLAAPAASHVVRIDVNVQSFRDGSASQASATVDLSQMPPPKLLV